MEIVEDKYLSSADEIKSYFEDVGPDFFDCGQGYYEEKVEVFVKIDDDFYLVKIEAEILGDKQDRGDRLYYVDQITSVTYSSKTKEEVFEVINRDISRQIAHHNAAIEKLLKKLIS